MSGVPSLGPGGGWRVPACASPLCLLQTPTPTPGPFYTDLSSLPPAFPASSLSSAFPALGVLTYPGSQELLTSQVLGSALS